MTAVIRLWRIASYLTNKFCLYDIPIQWSNYSKVGVQILVHSLVHSHIDYCNSLLAGMPHNLLHHIQKIQNFAARVVTNSHKFCHIMPILRSLHWLPVEMRIRYKIIVTVYKSIHNMAPYYLQHLTLPAKSSYNLRNKSAIWLDVPKVSCVSLGGRAFARLGPQWWNNLPIELRKLGSFPLFLKALKTHLFLTYFS